MSTIRNLATFILIAVIATGCGGGGSGVTSSDSSSGSNTSSGNTGSTASVTLKWSAPTTRLDGSAISLSEIAGYRLYYGSSATNTPNYINLNGTSTQYPVTLPNGTYYFRISAIDTNGYEGALSGALQKTL